MSAVKRVYSTNSDQIHVMKSVHPQIKCSSWRFMIAQTGWCSSPLIQADSSDEDLDNLAEAEANIWCCNIQSDVLVNEKVYKVKKLQAVICVFASETSSSCVRKKKKNASGNNRVDNYLLRQRVPFFVWKMSTKKRRWHTNSGVHNWQLGVIEKQNQHRVPHHRPAVRGEMLVCRRLIVNFIKVW